MGEFWGPTMFVSVLGFIFIGYPVAFVLAGTALIFALAGSLVGDFDLVLLRALPDRTFGVMSNYTLLAVPYFIFMGALLEKSKMAEDLLETIGVLFGNFRGGLAIGVVGVGMLFAAATGVVGASVTAMGLISFPVMQRHGYREDISLGVISAAGTLGQIIPPSIVLIVLGDQMGVSVGALFRTAVIPGVALTLSYVLYILLMAWIVPESMPPVKTGVHTNGGTGLLKRVLGSMLPPIVLILIVLGSIFLGIATPTEAGSLGAVGALVLSFLNGKLSLKILRESMEDTVRLTVMVVFLLIGSTVFTLVLRGFDGDLWIADMLSSLPGGTLSFLLLINLLVFFLGFFIDFFEIAFIIIPLIILPAQMLGIDLVWLAIILAVNIQTSFLTPPFGFSLFYLRGVTPATVPTSLIYKGAVPFIGIQLTVLFALIFWVSL
ncbi:MAG: TRAP transporter large permease subunit [Longimicrobiales bacterium]|jgi:tripartite ATP-independent transporter DctM subunit|nr:TRAP transporter large permease subunit [Longimicrobiales bacterium]